MSDLCVFVQSLASQLSVRMARQVLYAAGDLRCSCRLFLTARVIHMQNSQYSLLKAGTANINAALRSAKFANNKGKKIYIYLLIICKSHKVPLNTLVWATMQDLF